MACGGSGGGGSGGGGGGGSGGGGGGGSGGPSAEGPPAEGPDSRRRLGEIAKRGRGKSSKLGLQNPSATPTI